MIVTIRPREVRLLASVKQITKFEEPDVILGDLADKMACGMELP